MGGAATGPHGKDSDVGYAADDDVDDNFDGVSGDGPSQLPRSRLPSLCRRLQTARVERVPGKEDEMMIIGRYDDYHILVLLHLSIPGHGHWQGGHQQQDGVGTTGRGARSGQGKL